MYLLHLRIISFDTLEVPKEQEFQISHCCKSMFINFHGFLCAGSPLWVIKALAVKPKPLLRICTWVLEGLILKSGIVLSLVL